MDTQRIRLLMQIDIAFARVRLGDGIGVHEASRIEMEEKPETVAEGRRLDRAQWENWKDIDERYIESFPFMMHYMDPFGRRWVLPAFLRFALLRYKEGATAIDALFDILEREKIGVDRWSLLNRAQKQTVAQVLRYLIDTQSPAIDIDAGKRALEKVWRDYL